MNNHLPILAATLTAAFATALGAQNMTSPPGYLTTEGQDYVDSLAGGVIAPHGHILHVDDALRTSGAHSIRRLLLRRDGGLPTNAAYAARTLPVAIRMAQVDYTKVVSNGDPVSEAVLRLTPWTTAFAERMVSLPSLVTRPVTAPAPWSISFLLDAPYPYQPTSALAIHLRFGPNGAAPPAAYALDWVEETSPSRDFGSTSGVGCQITGQPGRFRLEGGLTNYGDIGSRTDFFASMSNGVASTPWVIAMGASDPGLSFGGCESLRTSAQIVLPLPTTNATGAGLAVFQLAHHQSMVGANLWLQAVQPYGSASPVPIALSNGLRLTYPANPPASKLAVSIVWSSSPNLGTAHSFSKGASLVFGLDW